ncbi:beta-glucosidase BglX [Plebeiibacterium sediminum]|uniref:beta-glucosidase n=1 Tax=Plebeiibacterium sediminum TaxID=2992112 RepID=A0AAE3M2Z8_9BACT|nr:beta-glucosidase BglX [Plebeiobacterium sediminum]MCW3785855.1 beta-glucosidase BglX [Plebeiobacterium sediminum]
MKKNILAGFMAALIVSCSPADHTKVIDSTEKKVEELLSKMTLDEKIGQLNQYTSSWEMTGPVPEGKDQQDQLEMIKSGLVGSMLNVTGAEATRKAQTLAVENSRLGIPMIFGYDVVHGYKTMLPIPLAAASSWNPEVARQSCEVAAREAAASGIHWTFAPMIDIARDARWGRVMEGAGEDPYLGSIMAAAQVKGFQGDSLNSINTVAACAKHFAAYGFAEAGRDYNTVEITEHTLRNTVLPPFKAAVDAGVSTIMNSFNIIGGIPSTSNHHLLRDILKGEWQFDGFVISDWNSIGEIRNHGVASTKKEAAYLAINAGTDMDMEGDCYVFNLKQLVEEGKVSEATIDDAVRRVLKIKYELGLFDDPYKYCNEENEKVQLSQEHLDIARDLARKSVVLLKNNNQILPLQKDQQKIGVIGALANDKDSPLGSWRAQAVTGSAVSLLEGINNVVKNKGMVKYAQGPEFVTNTPKFTEELQFNESDLSGIKEAVKLAKKVDVVVMALGENCFQAGEGRSQTNIEIKGVQQQLFDAIYAVNKNIVVVLMNGRPVVLNNIAQQAQAIVETWHLGSEAGNAIADVLFGDYNPSGKLPVSFPRSVGQCPIYYNQFSTGRSANTDNNVFWSHYTDEAKTPLYPFGYGLSYTSFEYSNIELSSNELFSEGSIEVSATISNTGKFAGKETVQLYVQDLFGSIARPIKELKGFQQIELTPGESKKVTFKISKQDLTYYTAQGKWDVEPGDFKVWIGTNSQEGLEGNFTLN